MTGTTTEIRQQLDVLLEKERWVIMENTDEGWLCRRWDDGSVMLYKTEKEAHEALGVIEDHLRRTECEEDPITEYGKDIEDYMVMRIDKVLS